MGYNQIDIKNKVKLLVELQLEKGVQPEELVSNIRNDGYTEISIKRVFNKIKCIVTFNDTDLLDETKTKYQYIYIYNEESFLEEINVKKNGKTINIWSRKEEELILLNDIIETIRKSKDDRAVSKFIKTLPDSIKSRLALNYTDVLNIV